MTFTRPTPTQISAAKLSFKAAGITARFAKTRYGFRLVFSGDRAPAFAILNGLGFRSPTGQMWAETPVSTQPTEWEINVNLVAA